MSRNLAALAGLGLGFVLLGLPSVCASDSKKESLADTEAKRAAKEDEAERNAHETEQIQAAANFVGKVVMGTDGLDQPGPGVVGSLTQADGRIFQLKLADQGLLQKLNALNDKKAVIQGKLRNEGKYLVVTAVSGTLTSGGSPPEMHKRGGI